MAKSSSSAPAKPLIPRKTRSGDKIDGVLRWTSNLRSTGQSLNGIIDDTDYVYDNDELLTDS